MPAASRAKQLRAADRLPGRRVWLQEGAGDYTPHGCALLACLAALAHTHGSDCGSWCWRRADAVRACARARLPRNDAHAVRVPRVRLQDVQQQRRQAGHKPNNVRAVPGHRPAHPGGAHAAGRLPAGVDVRPLRGTGAVVHAVRTLRRRRAGARVQAHPADGAGRWVRLRRTRTSAGVAARLRAAHASVCCPPALQRCSLPRSPSSLALPVCCRRPRARTSHPFLLMVHARPPCTPALHASPPAQASTTARGCA